MTETLTAPSAVTTPPPIPEIPNDMQNYLREDSAHFGLQQLQRSQSITYFYSLLRELFSAGIGKTKMIFAMLHILMTDSRISWSNQELADLFHWMQDNQRQYLISRLSSSGWLEYHREKNSYMFSDIGEALMRLLSRLTMGQDLVENEGAAVADIEFSILLEARDINERLQFLSNRLHKHIVRAETALNTNSPYIILEIYQQIKSAYRWAEKTRETLDHLQPQDDDAGMWQGIRDVHHYLSQLHSLISRMQLRLQEIQNKQIDIAQYGLSQIDYDYYFRETKIPKLATMMEAHWRKVPHPFFINEKAFLAEVQYIMGRERQTYGDQRGWNTEIADVPPAVERETAREADAFRGALDKLKHEWQQVSGLISTVGWNEAAYRFSLLTLIADRNSTTANSAAKSYDPFVCLPVEVEFNQHGEMCTVDALGETLTMTVGMVKHQ